MKLLCLLAFIALVVLGDAAAPSVPTWPDAFSASVGVFNSENPERNGLIRWFHDAKAGFGRIDSFINFNGNFVFRKHLVNWAKSQEWEIIYVNADEVLCYTRALSGTQPPAPDFSNYNYLGLALINDNPVNNWGAFNRTAGNFFQYFEDVTTREPVRFNYFNREQQEEQWNFWEFDAATQDPDLWFVSANVLSVCNQADNASKF